MQKHAITPPPEVVERLRKDAPHGIRDAGVTRELHLITAAYQAGADQELEACCAAIKLAWGMERVMTDDDLVRELRLIRRPKPLSLKEQALAVLQQLSESGYPANYQPDSAWDTIRRAIDALPD